jgi:prepilin-type N-terminal cleavage/methylation domain-containing protein
MIHLHRDTGYTLIELLVVLVIVGILAIAGAAWTLNRPTTAVRGVTNDVYGLIRAAQTLARNSGRNVALQTQGTEPGRTLTLSYGFFAQKSDGTDDFTKGPGSTSSNPVMGALTIDLSLSRYAQVGDATTGQFAAIMPNPAPQNDTVLKTLEPSSFWTDSTKNLFQGGSAPSNTFYFLPDGTPNADFYIPITGVRSGVISSGLPVGLILASQKDGLLAFLKSQSNSTNSPWSRL